ncbi:hypothetical protein EDB86DRAFT_2937227 [Lactarius hatsudake]|nr:hypothetical protein EDB86DRAFT_2937227 [Lactarius hatsudake]
MLSVTSCIMIFTKMQLELVVSSSFILIVCGRAQEMASFAKKWPKAVQCHVGGAVSSVDCVIACLEGSLIALAPYAD